MVQFCSAIPSGGLVLTWDPHSKVQATVETFQDFFGCMIFPEFQFPFKTKNLVTWNQDIFSRP